MTIFVLAIVCLFAGLGLMAYNAHGLWFDSAAQRRKRALRMAERSVSAFRCKS